MTYLSIMEKLKILFNLLLDYEFILVISVILLLFTFCYAIKKMSTKKYIFYMILSFAIIFGISIISNYKELSNTFDNFTTIFFENIYFPSIYVYIGVLVVSFIAFIVSMLNVMLKKIYKVINSIMFVVNNIMFVVILNIIAKNKIDIFSINSLYTNTSLVAVLELSMGLCILWILSLIVVYVTNVICDRLAYKKVRNTKEKEGFNPVLEINDDSINNINVLSDGSTFEDNSLLVEQVNNINEDIVIDNDAFEDVIVQNNDNEVKDSLVLAVNNTCNDTLVIDMEEVVEENTSLTFNDILNGCVPVTYYDNSVNSEEYGLFDPQMMYENNYNKIKSESIIDNEISLSDLLIEENTVIDNEISFIEEDETFRDKNVSFVSGVNEISFENTELSVEELTQIEKEKASEERLMLNTISLNDLIDDEEISVNKIDNINTNKVNMLEVKSDNISKEGYTIDDYKMMVEMLNAIKSHSVKTNINIDDAVAISLISNYSIDDCLKFKNLLESNLN